MDQRVVFIDEIWPLKIIVLRAAFNIVPIADRLKLFLYALDQLRIQRFLNP